MPKLRAAKIKGSVVNKVIVNVIVRIRALKAKIFIDSNRQEYYSTLCFQCFDIRMYVTAFKNLA